MLVNLEVEKEKERSIIKEVLSNHGIDNRIMANSITAHLLKNLDIQKKKYN